VTGPLLALQMMPSCLNSFRVVFNMDGDKPGGIDAIFDLLGCDVDYQDVEFVEMMYADEMFGAGIRLGCLVGFRESAGKFETSTAF
jgi:hypothetical protein